MREEKDRRMNEEKDKRMKEEKEGASKDHNNHMSLPKNAPPSAEAAIHPTIHQANHQLPFIDDFTALEDAWDLGSSVMNQGMTKRALRAFEAERGGRQWRAKQIQQATWSLALTGDAALCR
eukprot:CAMPEP_0175086710 /NCGR_PEP_ID=MMETSP0052_2-20121109/29411_1 /TAXON_ID=51329 ORGANISM="Polytomella parva, Strain SAG 63-3" /NCGR_SAMPLE_ID=MMETSP0052_2 /ASSEMBLY_ACC=CAM_ASM_000194 /LENGTH=120 /DNA_ID=CAMNT_0016358945 /DNA_START=65 /DNA_END=423 /DNA_ORIENTATION=-